MTFVNLVFGGKKMIQRVFNVATWHDRLVAGRALGGKLVAVAVAAHQRITLAGEGLVCQRAVATETAETVCVVMSVLIEEFLEKEERQRQTFKDWKTNQVREWKAKFSIWSAQEVKTGAQSAHSAHSGQMK